MSEADGPCEHRWVTTRLWVMFFLQWATQGVYGTLLGRCLLAPVEVGGLGFTPNEVGLLFGLPGTLAALVSPLIGGQLSDRYFPTQRFLGTLQLVLGALLWVLPSQKRFAVWLALLVVISLAYGPTVSLANALAFAHLRDPKKQFAWARLGGTIGWIVANWGFPMLWLQTDLHLRWLPPFIVGTEVPNVTARLLDAVRVGACLSVLFGLYTFTLPHTPPKRQGVDPLAFRKAFKLFRHRSFLVLAIAGPVIGAIHGIYFWYTSQFLSTLGLRDSDIQPAMSTGQIAEILFMVVLPWLLRRLGFRWVIALGVFAYALRFAIFGTTWLPVGVIIASQGLHGVCFACFYTATFIYIDRLADADIRASAQSLISIVFGLAPLLGGTLSAQLAKGFTRAGVLQFSPFWYSLAAIGLLATLFVATFFREDTPSGDKA
ncbi:MAG: MFS transporter [Planctomycetes bacterium]|nr:MFS transporter [Planctomycetota bacterium]